MAVVLRATTEGFTTEKYDELVRRLETAGAGAPAGRLYHVCFGDTNALRVSDIWDSPASFQRFSETLGPIMTELGLPKPEIEFFEVYNIIVGENSASAGT